MGTIKRFVLSSLAFSLFLFAPAAFPESAPKLLRLCYDEWPPSTIFPTEQNPQRGFTIDMLTHIFSSNGYQVKYMEVPYARGIELVRQGDCDLLAEVPDGAAKGVLYPEMNTFTYKQVFFVKKGSVWSYNGVASLKGLRVGNIAGYDYTSIDPEFQSYLQDPENKKNITVLAGETALPQMMKMISAGRIDTFNEALLIGTYVIQRQGLTDTLTVAGASPKSLSEKPVFSPVHPNAKTLMKIWDEGRKKLRLNGKDKTFLEKYGLKNIP